VRERSRARFGRVKQTFISRIDRGAIPGADSINVNRYDDAC